MTPGGAGELERLAATCLFPGFGGVEAPDWVLRRIEGGLGGVVLFARNVRDREQLAALTAALRAERADVLVAADEEGGDVTRLEAAAGSSYPGNLALGTVDDLALTEEVAGAIAADLAAVGINVDLAPVADVNTNPDNPIVGVRAFGSDPALVARHVAAFVTGLQRGGVAACAKHFPGHGATTADSHLELPTVERDRAGLLAEELPPFRAAIQAGVRAIMTAHIRLPALDDAPATLSRAVLGGLLRGELGFDGLVITDALEMRAVSGTVGVDEGAVRALEAGADALCLGADIGDADVASVQAAVVAAVRSGRLAEARLDEAAGRVRDLAAWAADLPRPTATRGVGLTVARRALRAEGRVRLERPPLVVELLSAPSIAAGEARHGLAQILRALEPATELVRLDEGADPATDGRQPVVVVRDAHRHAWQRALVERLLASASDAVVVETGVPAWRPDGAAGYLATHGAGRVNLEAAAERLLGSGPVS